MKVKDMGEMMPEDEQEDTEEVDKWTAAGKPAGRSVKRAASFASARACARFVPEFEDACAAEATARAQLEAADELGLEWQCTVDP